MRPMLLALSLLLLVSCASGTAGGRPAPAPEPKPKEKSAPQKIQARDIHEVKAAISRNLTSAEKARIGFSAHPDETSRKIAETLGALFAGSVSLELAGLDGLTPEETLAQLDPRNIPSMAYINYKRDGDLAVSLYATDGTMARDLFFDYKYSDISPALSARMERVASLPFRAEHAACDDEGNMYLRNGQATVILSPGAGKELFRELPRAAAPRSSKRTGRSRFSAPKPGQPSFSRGREIPSERKRSRRCPFPQGHRGSSSPAGTRTAAYRSSTRWKNPSGSSTSLPFSAVRG